MGHFMLGTRYAGRCADGILRTITVDDVSPASTDGTCGGLYLTGIDVDGYRHGAYTDWTHAEYVVAVHDVNGNPRRGWKVMDGHTLLRFHDEGYAGTLTNATGDKKSPYPYELGASARWKRITVGEYRALKALENRALRASE